MANLSEEYRSVYERILYSWYLSKTVNKGQGHILEWLEFPGFRRTAAYAQYNMLLGRSDLFMAFIRNELGYASDDEALADLEARYGSVVAAKIESFKRMGR